MNTNQGQKKVEKPLLQITKVEKPLLQITLRLFFSLFPLTA
jgi:hypothetical protein